MPLSREGPAARAQSAATVGASSLVSSKSPPLISGPPLTVRVPPSSVTVAPMAARMPRQRSPTWVVSAGQFGIRTVPPVARAAARNGPALERSCSIRWSKARIGPGETTQWFGTESSTATPTPRSTATVMLMWSRLGTGLSRYCGAPDGVPR